MAGVYVRSGMITTTPGTSNIFATCLWDSTTGAYPPRPNANVVRFVGPVQPARSEYQDGDEWRSYTVARSPIELTGCVLWLDADTLGLDYTDSDPLDDWPARIGPTPTATTTQRPTWDETGGPNGGGVVFNGSSNRMTFPQQIFNRITYDFTIVAVLNFASNSGSQTILSNDLTGYNGDLLWGIYTNSTFGDSVATKMDVMIHRDDGEVVRDFAGDADAAATSVWKGWAARLSGGSTASGGEGTLELWDLGSDNTSPIATDSSISTTTTRLTDDQTWYIGYNPNAGSRFLNATLAELIVFDRALASYEMEALDLWLDDKHGALSGS